MTYLANDSFSYSIKHVVHFFKKDQEVVAPADDIEYMLKQKFIRDDKKESNGMTAEQLKKAIEKLTAKISKEMNEDKLAELDAKKQEFEAELARLEA